MKKTVSLLMVAIFFIFAGCSQNQNAPVSNPQTSMPAEQKTQTEPKQEAEKPLADWEKDWNQTVEAAKKEGRLVIAGPVSQVWRDPILSFQKEYPEIKIEYTSADSRDFWPRVDQERKLGQYLWDLRVGGPDKNSYTFKNEKKAMAPTRPLLVLPEVLDESKWIGGFDKLFADKEKEYFINFASYRNSMALVNRDVVPVSEFNSDEDLLDPKWKGKITIQDPRGGAGLVLLAAILKAHGEDFVEELLTKQDVVVVSDSRQQTEWLARGNYPIAIGVASAQLKLLQDQGVGVNVAAPEKGASVANAGVGGIQLLDKAPNPNAAKVFINWILTRDVQDRIMQAVSLNSSRNDVQPGDQATVLDPNGTYIYGQVEEQQEYQLRASEMANRLIK